MRIFSVKSGHSSAASVLLHPSNPSFEDEIESHADRLLADTDDVLPSLLALMMKSDGTLKQLFHMEKTDSPFNIGEASATSSSSSSRMKKKTKKKKKKQQHQQPLSSKKEGQRDESLDSSSLHRESSSASMSVLSPSFLDKELQNPNKGLAHSSPTTNTKTGATTSDTTNGTTFTTAAAAAAATTTTTTTTTSTDVKRAPFLSTLMIVHKRRSFHISKKRFKRQALKHFLIKQKIKPHHKLVRILNKQKQKAKLEGVHGFSSWICSMCCRK